MLKQCFLILYVLPVCLVGQSSSLISDLDYVLFEKDIDTSYYLYSYWSIKEQDSISVKSRYLYSPHTLKSGLVEKICDTIRWKRATHLIPELSNLLEEQEEVFLNEWNPVFDFTGAPEGLWEDQFNSLCLIDLTLSYLTIIEEQWGPQRKYDFLKNLYLLSYGDFDKSRVNETLYKSQYIINKHGYCRCNLIQKPNFENSLIDEFFYDDPYLLDILLQDIHKSSMNSTPDDEKKFFNTGVRNVLHKFSDVRIDSLLIYDSQELINLGFSDKVNIWTSRLPVKYYHLLLRRYRLASKNEFFIDLILEDIFGNIKLGSDKKTALGILLREKDHLIDYKIREKFLIELLVAKTEDELTQLISLLESSMTLGDREKLKAKLMMLSEDNILSIQSVNKVIDKL